MKLANSPTSLLDFIRRRVGVGELVRRRVDWLPLLEMTTYGFFLPPRLMVLMSLRVEQTSENLVLLLSPFLITTTTNATTAVAVATTLFQ